MKIEKISKPHSMILNHQGSFEVEIGKTISVKFDKEIIDLKAIEFNESLFTRCSKCKIFELLEDITPCEHIACTFEERDDDKSIIFE